MTVTYTGIRRYAFSFLALPGIVFALGFLKWYIGVPMALLILCATVWMLMQGKTEPIPTDAPQLRLKRWQCLALLGIVTLWCLLSGLGNLYYQSSDWGARNAIFRDLIRFDWPVVYASKNAALVYYIGFWLPPALVGKLFLALGCSIETAFAIGNIALLLFAVAHLYVILLLVMLFTRADTPKRFFAVILIFIGFSGWDILGAVVKLITVGTPIPRHLEWWTHYQFSAITTCLGWVFNQAIPAWLTVACFLHEKKLSNYAFLVVMCAASAPLPCVGLAAYMLAVLVWRAVCACRQRQLPALLREILTPQNLIAVFLIFPMWLLYYLSNMAVGAEPTLKQTQIDYPAVAILLAAAVAMIALAVWRYRRGGKELSLLLPGIALLTVGVWGFFNADVTWLYLWSLLLESALYLGILWWSERDTLLYRVALFSAVLLPLFKIGTDFDFCMRASIPTVFILAVLSIRFLLCHEEAVTRRRTVAPEQRLPRVLCLVLIGVLLVGSVTLMAELVSGVRGVIEAGRLNAVNDGIYTFDQIFTGERYGADRNFIAERYLETFFFRYLAK